MKLSMWSKPGIALAAILLAASATGASAQSLYPNNYEPTGTVQGLWAPSQHPHQARVISHHHPAQRISPNAVMENGQYLGQDPDPNVRLMLERDESWR